MANTVFDVLVEKLEAQRDNASLHLANGHAQDHSQYREVVGLIRGLDVAKQLVQDLERAYVGEDND